MSYNYSVLFKKPRDCPLFNIKPIQNSLNNPIEIYSAFIWVDTIQGEDFWSKFADGRDQEKGKAILRAFLNLDKIKLEDLI